jgi:hypothetical protein
MDWLHLLEFFGIALGGSVALLRFWPNLRQLAIILQIIYVVFQIVNMYLKAHPDKKLDPKAFIRNVLEHYFRTHPEGKALALTSDIDERTQSVLSSKDTSSLDWDEFLGFSGKS